MSARMDRLEFYRAPDVVKINLRGEIVPDWRWRYVAANGHILAVSSEGYRRRIDAVKAAARVLALSAAYLNEAVALSAGGSHVPTVRVLTPIRVVVKP